MSENGILRRSSYGPTSPVVGERGARTRARVVTEALALFGGNGFHGTSVDDIARAAGISRATLYQYFESKEQIFVELLDECGGALMRVIRRIGPLGPTELGFDNLHWWLGEWAWVYDKYATMFIQWANVDSPGTRVRPLVTAFIEAYNRRIAGRLAASELTGVTPDEAAMVITGLVNRFNFFRHMGVTRKRTDDELLDNLAVVVQLMLFPSTPAEAFTKLLVLPAPREGTVLPLAAVPAAYGRRVAEELAARPNRFEGLSARASVTVRQLIDAGAVTFSDRGYHRTSIDDVVAQAGLARGTFYKYFDEKLDLLVTLAEECSERAVELAEGFVRITPGPAGAPALREWLARFVAFHQRYAGVFRMWLDRFPDDERLARTSDLVGLSWGTAFRVVLGQVERNHPLDLRVAGLVLLALLERTPEVARETPQPLPDDEVIELLATMIERGLFNRGSSASPPDPHPSA